MSDHPYKIVFSDIDGTLLNGDRVLSQSTIQQIQNLNDKVPVILISARMPSAMKHLQEDLEIGHQPYIAYNGGLILIKDKEVKSVEIPLNVLEGLNNFNLKFNCHLSLYHSNEWYVPQIDEWAKREENNTKTSPEVWSNKDVLRKWTKEKKGIHKIMAMGNEEHIDAIRDYLQANFKDEVQCYRSKNTYLEISPATVTKFSAIEYLLEKHYSFSPEEAIAFGDNYNDVEMLEKVGYGVAVGNARDEAKAVCNFVCEHHKEDGVAKVLEKIFTSV